MWTTIHLLSISFSLSAFLLHAVPSTALYIPSSSLSSTSQPSPCRIDPTLEACHASLPPHNSDLADLSLPSSSDIIHALDADQAEGTEENLVPAVPPAYKSKRWGLSIGLGVLLMFSCLAYTYRASLPHHFRLPTITANNLPSFTPPSSRPQIPKRFRPSPRSLLRWIQESDPSSSRSANNAQSERYKGLFLGELSYHDSAPDEEGYEEVGLLPSPGHIGHVEQGNKRGVSQGLQGFERKNYGSV